MKTMYLDLGIPSNKNNKQIKFIMCSDRLFVFHTPLGSNSTVN